MSDAFTLGPEERALLCGDLSRLSEQQRAELAAKTCASLGLNPYTRPFEYIVVKGQGNEDRLILYATRACTEQLRSSRKVSLEIRAREEVGDSYIVTARANLPDGRTDESIGAVSIRNVPFFDRDAKRWSKKDLQGDVLCNALMKAETKSKRRVTLSICGLGFLDESEIETIPGATLLPTPAPAVKAETPVALNPAAVQPTVADAVKAQPEPLSPLYRPSPIPDDLIALGKQLGKLPLAIARDIKSADGDIDDVREAYKGKIAERTPRGAQAPVAATVAAVTPSAARYSPPEEKDDLLEYAEAVLTPQEEAQEEAQDDMEQQTKNVVSLMGIFSVQKLVFPTIASRLEYCSKIAGRIIRGYSDLTCAELEKIGIQLVKDENPSSLKATQAQIHALQIKFRDVKIVARIKDASAYNECIDAGASQEDSIRIGRLAAASKWICRELTSFNDLTSGEVKIIDEKMDKERSKEKARK